MNKGDKISSHIEMILYYLRTRKLAHKIFLKGDLYFTITEKIKYKIFRRK